MEGFGDFLEVLGHDISSNIVGRLDDPKDIVRVSSVSSSWRRYVIENGFSKQLCLKLFPELSDAAYAIEAHGGIGPTYPNNPIDMENLSKSHKVYIFLALGLSPELEIDCICHAISATSTFLESNAINNTLNWDHTYWSSQGESNDMVPETLKYKVISTLCFLTEINIQFLQEDDVTQRPIFSAKAVRFRVSYRNSMLRAVPRLHLEDVCEQTYLSPVFQISQENSYQTFKLPEPVLCIDGTLEIDFLGRIKHYDDDDLYYIRVVNVEVMGRALEPGFDDKLDHPRNWGGLLSLGN